MGYFYGEPPDNCYHFFPPSDILEFVPDKKDKRFKKPRNPGTREIKEDLQKAPPHRWRGAEHGEDYVIPSWFDLPTRLDDTNNTRDDEVQKATTIQNTELI